MSSFFLPDNLDCSIIRSSDRNSFVSRSGASFIAANLTLFKRIYNTAANESLLDSARLPPAASPHVFRSCSVKLQCPRAESRLEAESIRSSVRPKAMFPSKMEFARSFAVRRGTKQRDRFRKLLANSLALRLESRGGQSPAD